MRVLVSSPLSQPGGLDGDPSEGLNSIIKKVKRVAAGFKNFDNYRVRILLACGGCNWNLLTQ